MPHFWLVDEWPFFPTYPSFLSFEVSSFPFRLFNLLLCHPPFPIQPLPYPITPRGSPTPHFWLVDPLSFSPGSSFPPPFWYNPLPLPLIQPSSCSPYGCRPTPPFHVLPWHHTHWGWGGLETNENILSTLWALVEGTHHLPTDNRLGTF